MIKSFRSAALLALLASALAPVTTNAGPETGWPRWIEKAKSITDLIEDGTPRGEDKRQRMKARCKGVSGIVIGSGFQMPYFAQQLMQVCSFIDEAVGPDLVVSSRKWHGDCRNVGHAAHAFEDAKEVPGYPQVYFEAHRLSFYLSRFYDQQCKHGLKRERD